VNIAARLEGLAEPGGVCISRGNHDHFLNRLPFKFEDLGEKSVKNIAQPIRVFRLLLDGREPGLPPLEREPMSTDEAPLPDGEGIPSLVESVVQTSDPLSVEIEFWDSIKNSTRADEYEACLEQYPDGSFVTLARVRLEAIR
jgi:adenylate cyclase